MNVTDLFGIKVTVAFPELIVIGFVEVELDRVRLDVAGL
jgi:hypothetical protein